MKIVINTCFGGYSLSKAAYEKLGLKWDGYGYALCEDREHPELIKVVEELGNAANGDSSMLKVVEIPDDVDWQIDEYDGIEWVAEKHRTWR